MSVPTPTSTARVVTAAEAQPLLEGPLGAFGLADAAATGGAAAFVIHTLAPRALGAPVHTHSREDEWSFVLDGIIGIQLGDEDYEAGSGDLVLKPRAVPHAFWNGGDEPARLLEVITPGGFEAYFPALGRIFGSGDPPDPAAMMRLADDFGVQMDLGSIPDLVNRHRLAMP